MSAMESGKTCRTMFVCRICKNRFEYAKDLIEHKKIHSKDNLVVKQKSPPPIVSPRVELNAADGAIQGKVSNPPRMLHQSNSKSKWPQSSSVWNYFKKGINGCTGATNAWCNLCYNQGKITKLAICNGSMTTLFRHLRGIHKFDPMLKPTPQNDHNSLESQNALRVPPPQNGSPFPSCKGNLSGDSVDNCKQKTSSKPNTERKKWRPLGGVGRYKCRFCAKILTRSCNRALHEKIHRNRFTCVRCTTAFPALPQLIAHLSECPLPNLTCSKSDRKIGKKNENHQGEHRQSSSSNVNLKCKYCDTVFDFPCRLKRHEAVHTLPFSCPSCPGRFARKASLNAHLPRCSPQNATIPENDGKMEHDEMVHKTNSKNVNLKCKFCGKTFDFPSYLKRHEATHTFPFSCGRCHRRFAMKESLKAHFPLCTHGKETAIKGKKLTRVQSPRPSTIQEYNCNECPFKTGKSQAFRYHRTLHTRKAKYECAFCSASFGQLGRLNTHVYKVHRDIRVPNSVGPTKKGDKGIEENEGVKRPIPTGISEKVTHVSADDAKHFIKAHSFIGSKSPIGSSLPSVVVQESKYHEMKGQLQCNLTQASFSNIHLKRSAFASNEELEPIISSNRVKNFDEAHCSRHSELVPMATQGRIAKEAKESIPRGLFCPNDGDAEKSCEFCNFKSIYELNMMRHVEKHHKGTNTFKLPNPMEKLFQCTICKEHFSILGNLKTHFETDCSVTTERATNY